MESIHCHFPEGSFLVGGPAMTSTTSAAILLLVNIRANIKALRVIDVVLQVQGYE